MRLGRRPILATAWLLTTLGVSGCVAVLETNQQQLLVDSVTIDSGPDNVGFPAVRVHYWLPSCTESPQVTVARVERTILVRAAAKRVESCLFASSAYATHVQPLPDVLLGAVTVRILQPDGETQTLNLVVGPGA